MAEIELNMDDFNRRANELLKRADELKARLNGISDDIATIKKRLHDVAMSLGVDDGYSEADDGASDSR